MSIISIKDLTFAYEGTYENIFEKVSLNLDTAWRLALIGRNGRGKTTLLKLLCGELNAKGAVSSSVKFTYFPFDIPDECISVEELCSSVCPNAQQWEIDREFNELCIKNEILKQRFNLLSGGEKTKVMLALMFLRENEFFLIDEPTNHLDMVGREILGDYLRRKKGFILVSHDRALIDKCADRVLSINKTNIELIKGNFSTWAENTEYKEKFERKRNERLKAEIERLTLAAKRTGEWSDKLESTKNATRISGLRPDRGFIGAKSAKLMQQRKNAQRRIANDIRQKEALLANLERADELKIVPEASAQKKLVSFDNVSIFYDDRCVCENINFTLHAKERLFLEGINGSGKSSILKIVKGEPVSFTGKVYVAPLLKISYLRQDISGLSGRAYELAEETGLNKPVFMSMMAKLGFSSDDFYRDTARMSMGEKKKVLLAKSISENAQLYIWDEPLNYVDIISRMQIEEVVVKYSPSMLLTEHDRVFCENVATDILTIG